MSSASVSVIGRSNNRKVTAHGLTMETVCRHCEALNGVVVDWEELVWIAMKAAPAGWIVLSFQKAIIPALGCLKCQKPLECGLTPRWARDALNVGVISRYITKEEIRGVGREVKAYVHQRFDATSPARRVRKLAKAPKKKTTKGRRKA